MRKPEHVMGELLADSRAAGQQYLGFQEYRDGSGKRVYYDANGCLNYQEAQSIAGEDVCPVPYAIYADVTYGRKNLDYRVVYRE